MFTTITTEKHPILLWAKNIEDGALQQAKNLANLPFIHNHVSIMADAHLGYGMPIGGIIATKNMIIPNGVGVDIGCGVCAQKTNLKRLNESDITSLFSNIRKRIPLGFKHHKKSRPEELMPVKFMELNPERYPIITKEYHNATKQLGTLGGGNHFIELQQDKNKNIWIMVHSGSRNLGYCVANYHNKVAIEHNKKSKHPVPDKTQLAPLPFKSKQGQTYYNEMQFCLEFAYANRMLMMQTIKEVISNFSPSVSFSSFINIAHNYASVEYHFNKEVIVHRKGAIKAGNNELGIIPGSQGSNSYITKGKANPDSFCSCSHGAGRKLGRKQAQKRLDLHQEIQKLDKQGIIHSIRSKKDLDEASGAYKNIKDVIDQQKDLIEVETILQPLGVIKG